MLFNYGAIPQTYEDPNFIHPDSKAPGDNDPIDAVELSGYPIDIGDVVRVRILGVFGVIDEGETDWKLMVLNMESPLAKTIHGMRRVGWRWRWRWRWR